MNALLGRPRTRTYWVFVLVGLAGAALSLFGKSTPTFDPWSWLVWGRELLHGHLSLLYGPSWKPLPVMFTTVFALFGAAAPNLWLVVARAGLIVTVLMLFKLGARLVWRFSGGEYGPALLAGLLAAVAYTLGPYVIFDAALGNSEAILTAAVLIAFELAIDGRHRSAFVIGIVPALDRPESWAVWVPYGLWLMWRDRSARVLVLTLFAAVVLLWFVPQRLGSSSFTSSVTRAQNLQSHKISGASCPFCMDLKDVAWLLVPERLRYVAVASVLVGLLTLGSVLRSGRRPMSARPRKQALMAWGAIGAAGFGWWVLIALEAEFGFSGSSRYMLLGTCLVYLAGGVGYGLGAALAADLAKRAARVGSEHPQAVSAVLAVCGALTFMLVPSWAGTRDILRSPARLRTGLLYQGQLRSDLEQLIARAGGVQRLSCGQILVEYLQSPMSAWYFNRPISEINIEQSAANHTGRGRQVAPGAWPRVVIRASGAPGLRVEPTAFEIARWEHRAGHPYRVLRGREVTLYTDCGTG